MFKNTKLANGLRILTIPSKSSKTVTVLVLVAIGSKYERREVSGISHLLEHMYFKGTKKRPSPKDVAETLDKIGGSYNAFTGEEYTGYYAKVTSSHFDIALDWVSDIFLNSKIPAKDLAKEKAVVIEEINMIKDHPISYVQRVWTNLLYGDQPAGWDIAGTKESVLSITRKDLIEHMRIGYVAPSTVICIAGDVDNKDVENKVKKCFAGISKEKEAQKKPVIENQSVPGVMIEKRNTDQTHICLGVRAYDIFHPQRHTLHIIETILGKMMSSRLFVKIREELGLAYYVKTEYDASTDTGFLVTQAGVDNKKVNQAILAILKEYKKMASQKVSLEELHKAKENIKGRTTISLESSSAQAHFYGLQELLRKKIEPIEEIFKKIDKVTADDVLVVSRDIFRPEKLNLAAVGPVNSKELKKILKI